MTITQQSCYHDGGVQRTYSLPIEQYPTAVQVKSANSITGKSIAGFHPHLVLITCGTLQTWPFLQKIPLWSVVWSCLRTLANQCFVSKSFYRLFTNE